jgi:4-carboxymuconolactone decarboxylase
MARSRKPAAIAINRAIPKDWVTKRRPTKHWVTLTLLANIRRAIMKSFVAGLLTVGAAMVAGGTSAPVYAQAPASGAPSSSIAGTGPQPTPIQRMVGNFAPKLVELTDNVLFGDVWERPQLSKRDRSLVTVSALIAMNRPDQLRSHLIRARENGVTQDELVEAITHLAFYAGWPSAITAISVAKEVFEKK